MGLTKRALEEEEARGWRSAGDKHVCLEHIENGAIVAHLKEILDSRRCHYCDRIGASPIAAPVDVLIDLVSQSLCCEWGDPNDEGVPWDRGWVGKVFDTWDVLDELEEGNPFNCAALTADIVNAFGGRAWVQKDFYRLPLGKRLELGWDEFAKIVRYRSRDFLLADGAESDDPDALSPVEILEAIGDAVASLRLIRTLEADTKIYRGRPHTAHTRLKTADELGPPVPHQVLGSNRMSPAGVAHFYGALEAETALTESRAADSAALPQITVAAFRLTVPVEIVDLSDVPSVPSLFSVDREHRPSISFLRHFVREISVPVTRDDRSHIDYVPSQIVTEWFREAYAPSQGVPLAGLLYPSARLGGGTNLVLFIDKSQVADPGLVTDGVVLELVSFEER